MALVGMTARWLFIGLNVVYIMLGVLVFIKAAVLQLVAQPVPQMFDILGWMMTARVWLLGTSIIVVASLGLYGVAREKKWPLISFITANVIALLRMLMIEVPGLISLRMGYTQIGHLQDESELYICCGIVPLMLAGIIMASVIIHKIRRNQPAKY